MKLSEQRVNFTTDLGLLLTWAHASGYRAAIDQVKRTQLEANANAASGAGIKNSLHLQGLAADLLLYAPDGTYLPQPEHYSELGSYWKALRAGNCWGGDFTSKDAGHFSSTRDGIK